jgi:hypothetical protein
LGMSTSQNGYVIKIFFTDLIAIFSALLGIHELCPF